jgi:hypothetical protein
MRPPVIVVGEEFGESESALERGGIGALVGPATEECLDEAFGFSVGARAVGAGAQVAQSEPFAGGGKAAGDVARAVVGHDAGDCDAVAGVPGDEASKEGGSGWGSFISEDLRISKSGGIVDGDVDELPAGAPAVLPAVAGDAMADDLNATQLLGVDMDELAGMVSLVAADRFFRIQVLEPRETLASKDASHGGWTRADTTGDLVPGLSAPTQPEDLFDNVRMGLTRTTMGPRTAIDQRRLAGLLITTLPFRSRSAVNTGRLGGAGHGDAGLDALDEQHSTGRASSGILVKLHLGSSFVETVALDTSSLTEKGPDGQLPHGNNVLRNHN